MDYFIDSSALVQRYVEEPGSEQCEQLCTAEQTGEIFVAAIALVEVIATIARYARDNGSDPQATAAACHWARSDTRSRYQVVELNERVLARATILAETRQLLGSQAIQLASALEVSALAVASGLPKVTFVSAAAELRAIATAEGLLAIAPSDWT